MRDFTFDHPDLMHLLWFVPLLGALYVWGFARRRRALERFATVNLIGTLIPAVSLARQRMKAVLVLIASAFIAMAMTGPRWGTREVELQRRGVDIMFVLDVSNSMLAEDDIPNRLERAKLDIKDMLEVLPGDRVGLVTFAGESSRTCPLTINYGAFRMALDAVDTRSAPRGGTNVGDAVRMAARSFTDPIKDHKAIVVISDGEETDDSYAVEAAQNAFEERGIRVFTIGVGDPVEGGRIPIVRGGKRTYLQFQDQEVWTKLHPGLLQDMAAVADGGYFANTDYHEIYEVIAEKVQSRTFETERKEIGYARFHWFAGLALVFLTIETLMTDRKAATQ